MRNRASESNIANREEASSAAISPTTSKKSSRRGWRRRNIDDLEKARMDHFCPSAAYSAFHRMVPVDLQVSRRDRTLYQSHHRKACSDILISSYLKGPSFFAPGFDETRKKVDILLPTMKLLSVLPCDFQAMLVIKGSQHQTSNTGRNAIISVEKTLGPWMRAPLRLALLAPPNFVWEPVAAI
jgi:hypothetical protein